MSSNKAPQSKKLKAGHVELSDMSSFLLAFVSSDVLHFDKSVMQSCLIKRELFH